MKLPRASSLLALASLLAVAGCLEAPPPTQQAKQEAPAPTPKVEPPAPNQPVTAETDQGLKPTTEPMTAEELRLIAADPKTLTKEESILRGHALRKKVMLNPDSEAAQALNDARAAVLGGQVDPTPGAPGGGSSEDKGLVLQAPPHLVKDKHPSEPK